MKCTRCSTRIPEGKTRCPSCGLWGFAGDVSAELFQLGSLTSSDHDRLTSGPWDLAWGGGIVIDSVTFFAGEPGAGKSTCLMQIAAAIAAQGNVLYVSKEESLGQVKARADRLGLDLVAQNNIVVVRQFTGSIRDLAERVRPRLLVVDSLPALVGLGYGDVRESIEVLEHVKAFANETACPAIVVDHVNKRGEFSGPVMFEHLIDTTMMLRVDRKQRSFRSLVPVKNRFGDVNVAVRFQMTARGLVHVEVGAEEKYGSDNAEGEDSDASDV